MIRTTKEKMLEARIARLEKEIKKEGYFSDRSGVDFKSDAPFRSLQLTADLALDNLEKCRELAADCDAEVSEAVEDAIASLETLKDMCDFDNMSDLEDED